MDNLTRLIVDGIVLRVVDDVHQRPEVVEMRKGFSVKIRRRLALTHN